MSTTDTALNTVIQKGEPTSTLVISTSKATVDSKMDSDQVDYIWLSDATKEAMNKFQKAEEYADYADRAYFEFELTKRSSIDSFGLLPIPNAKPIQMNARGQVFQVLTIGKGARSFRFAFSDPNEKPTWTKDPVTSVVTWVPPTQTERKALLVSRIQEAFSKFFKEYPRFNIRITGYDTEFMITYDGDPLDTLSVRKSDGSTKSEPVYQVILKEASYLLQIPFPSQIEESCKVMAYLNSRQSILDQVGKLDLKQALGDKTYDLLKQKIFAFIDRELSESEEFEYHFGNLTYSRIDFVLELPYLVAIALGAKAKQIPGLGEQALEILKLGFWNPKFWIQSGNESKSNKSCYYHETERYSSIASHAILSLIELSEVAKTEDEKERRLIEALQIACSVSSKKHNGFIKVIFFQLSCSMGLDKTLEFPNFDKEARYEQLLQSAQDIKKFIKERERIIYERLIKEESEPKLAQIEKLKTNLAQAHESAENRIKGMQRETQEKINAVQHEALAAKASMNEEITKAKRIETSLMATNKQLETTIDTMKFDADRRVVLAQQQAQKEFEAFKEKLRQESETAKETAKRANEAQLASVLRTSEIAKKQSEEDIKKLTEELAKVKTSEAISRKALDASVYAEQAANQKLQSAYSRIQELEKWFEAVKGVVAQPMQLISPPNAHASASPNPSAMTFSAVASISASAANIAPALPSSQSSAAAAVSPNDSALLYYYASAANANVALSKQGTAQPSASPASEASLAPPPPYE